MQSVTASRGGAFYGKESIVKKQLWAGLAAALISLPALAGEVAVSTAWSRATAPGQDTGMVQAVITSKQAAQLVGAVSDASEAVEFHSMVHEGGMMKMRQVEAIDLPAGKSFDLGAEGYHLMLVGLKKPLVAGNQVELTLTLRFADGREEKVRTRAEIHGMTERKPQGQHEHMHH